MTPLPKPEKMWAVWSPNTGICTGLAWTSETAIFGYCGHDDWELYHREGFRCIPVPVTPILPKPQKKVKP